MLNYTTASLAFRAKLASLWASLMLIYLYADVLSFYRPGHINTMQEGMMGPLEATQTSLLIASILMLIPSLMVASTFVFSLSVTRKLSVVIGALYIAVNIGNLIGEIWLYYLTFGVVEIALTAGIVTLALRSKIEEN